MKKRDYTIKINMTKIEGIIEILFIALIANIGEFGLGWLIKITTGDFLWIYPHSFLVTTSVYAYPLWVIGLITIKIIRRFMQKLLTFLYHST